MRTLLALGLLASGCSSVTGAVRASGGALGTWTAAPARCHGGGTRFTTGAELELANGLRISVISDRVHGHWILVAQGDRLATLDARTCRFFVPWVSCDAWPLGSCDGALTVDCDLWGGTIAADVRFHGCQEATSPRRPL
jgi:hypothetical protein